MDLKSKKMILASFLLTSLLLVIEGSSVYVEKSAYKNIVVEIRDNVPDENCQTTLHNLEIMLTSASQYLFSALDGRVYFGDIIVVLPKHWPNTCIPYNQTRTVSSGEFSDVTIMTDTKQQPQIWTQQSAGCGDGGDQIFIDSDILGRDSMGREFVREWAKYRYGVFEEIGYEKDPVYPKCYLNDDHEVKLTGCSDAPVRDEGLCGSPSTPPKPFNISEIVDENARTSIMFAAEAPSVSMFCDEGTHNRYAPTKHNQMCDRRSTLDVILKHSDFTIDNLVEVSTSSIINTTPKFHYKSRDVTRYVIIIDETQDMQIRESWSFLRNAMRKWVVYDLPGNTEIGMALANDTATEKMLQISPLHLQRNRDMISSFIPYSPSDSRQPACLTCAISDAIHMLNERTRIYGPASSIILIIAPGMDYSIDHKSLSNAARAAKIRMTTINYPSIVRRQPLDALSVGTGGSSHSIYECKYNGEKTFLTTYFDLTNVLFNIGTLYYEGNKADLPIEIHRKELVDVVDDSNQISKRTSRMVSGSFMLDSTMGPPAYFFVYTHNVELPLIQNIKLISPSGVVHTSRSDSRLAVKQLMIPGNINETGSWTYTIERFNGNPQPHYVQVLATPRTRTAPVIKAKAWVHFSKNGGPPILYADVKKGDLPINSALVEVTVTRPDRLCNNGNNVLNECREKFQLLDTGSGDPDLTKGDGIYSKYFNAEEFGGPGAFSFEVTVTDNGNTAYSLAESANIGGSKLQPKKCCGSSIPIPLKQPLTTFQRVLPSLTIFISQENIDEANKKQLGRIGDLKAELLEGLKVRLAWTSPDMGGKNVARYEVKYATTIKDIVDNFETAAVLWYHDTPFTYSIGDDTTFTLNITNEPHLIGQVLYFAIRPFSKLIQNAEPGLISNYVRVFVPKPRPATTSPPSSSSGTENYDSIWSSYDGMNKNHDGHDNMDIIPRIAKIDLGPEIIIPIIAGILLLIALVFLICYFCVIKRRADIHDDEQKKPIKSFKSDHKLTSHSVIVTAAVTGSSPSSNSTNSSSSSPNHHQHHIQNSSSNYDMNLNEHQTVGLPTIYNIDDDVMMSKKRYSVINMPGQHPIEQQLIEELKQQQQIIDSQSFIIPNANNCSVSIISTASNNTTLTRNYNPNQQVTVGGRTLSPYESWSASQLLQEHEQHQRRHSPTLMDDLMDTNPQQQFYNVQQHDQISLMNHNMMNDNMSPPVPPLPIYTTTNSANVANNNYHIYGQQQQPAQYPQQSHQGSVNSVNSNLGGNVQNPNLNTDTKKRRNVTMV